MHYIWRMLFRNYGYFLLICCSLCFCVAPNKSIRADTTIRASALEVYGRHAFNEKQELQLISAAAHFGFSFEGDSFRLQVSLPHPGSHNYLQYEVDGVYQKRIRIDGSGSQPIVIKTTSRGKHEVWIYKATEAHTGDILISSIHAPAALPLQKKAAPLIEFIGNSITCGAAADPSEVPCGQGAYHDQHNAYMAYGPRVARALGAGFILNSVSGIGIYRNWNSEGPVMPDVYEKLDFQPGNSRIWDGSKARPELISLALGTNDFSNGDGRRQRLPFDSATFVNRYIAFVQELKKKQKAARIALLSSPMVHGNRNTTLQNCLHAVKKAIDRNFPRDQPVALFFFRPMTARGCTGHPSVEDHALLAEELLPFFKEIVGR